VLDGIAANPYADAVFALGDALCEMFDQHFASDVAALSRSFVECRSSKSARCREKSGRGKNSLPAAHQLYPIQSYSRSCSPRESRANADRSRASSC